MEKDVRHQSFLPPPYGPNQLLTALSLTELSDELPSDDPRRRLILSARIISMKMTVETTATARMKVSVCTAGLLSKNTIDCAEHKRPVSP